MKTGSVWKETKTFFPLFLDRLNMFYPKSGRVCVVGASDGKFVIPLAEAGWIVAAIEVDSTALYGGMVEFPEIGPQKISGLAQRLRLEGLEQQVEIINDNFLTCNLPNICSAIFTSCSWHYSRNHNSPVRKFIERMQALVARRGILCAEYMMPCEPHHENQEHYLKEGELRRYFTDNWEVLDEFYSVPFAEKAHVGNLADHIHRMGFLMARRIT